MLLNHLQADSFRAIRQDFIVFAVGRDVEELAWLVKQLVVSLMATPMLCTLLRQHVRREEHTVRLVHDSNLTPRTMPLLLSTLCDYFLTVRQLITFDAHLVHIQEVDEWFFGMQLALVLDILR